MYNTNLTILQCNVETLLFNLIVVSYFLFIILFKFDNLAFFFTDNIEKWDDKVKMLLAMGLNNDTERSYLICIIFGYIYHRLSLNPCFKPQCFL